MTHISVSKLTIVGSDNGLSPGQCQAIIWTNAGILFIRILGSNFSEILIEIHIFSFKKMHLKMLSGKCRPFYLSLNVLSSQDIDSVCQEYSSLSTRRVYHIRFMFPILEIEVNLFLWPTFCVYHVSGFGAKRNHLMQLLLNSLAPGEYSKTSLMISQDWFRWWLGAVKQQAITWANVDTDLCCYMPLLHLNGLRNGVVYLLYACIIISFVPIH